MRSAEGSSSFSPDVPILARCILTECVHRWEIQACSEGSTDSACHMQAAKTLLVAAEYIHSNKNAARSPAELRQVGLL